MPVLSDGTIRGRLGSGELVLDGNPDYAQGCSYKFRPGKLVCTGGDESSKRIHDWTAGTDGTSLFDVSPAELVWIRTRERVSMPLDVCAFWWQTSTLSRQGLMLVNMSLVEPGYEGYLACLFANFGKEKVTITPDTVVAKLVFHQLDAPAERGDAYRVTEEQYDRSIVEAAKRAPRSFLDIEAMAKVLDTQRDEAVRAIGAAGVDAKTKLESDALAAGVDTRKTLEADATKVRDDFKKDLAGDTRKTATRYFALVVLAFALVVAAVTFVPWLQSNIQPGLNSQVTQDVNDALTQRLGATISGSDVAKLQQQVSTLQNEVKSLTASLRRGTVAK